jgi:hypothetical protein
MSEIIIKFTDVDVDGNGIDISTLARIYGKDVTVGTIDRVKDAICNYKNESDGEWDTDGCFNAAKEQLEFEGYEVDFIEPTIEICF